MTSTCIFHVFVQQVLQVLLLVIVELSLQRQQDVFVQQHPDQVEGTCLVGPDSDIYSSLNVHRWSDCCSACCLSAV